MNNIQIIILAAGKGSRMKSKKTKVLHELAGKTLLQMVFNTAKKITNNITIVHNDDAKDIKNSLNGSNITWILQSQQLGTANAIYESLKVIDKNKICIILYADVPLISTQTIKKLTADFTILTTIVENPAQYGRIVRYDNKVRKIIEHKDANDDELKITEINTGIIAVRGDILHKYIPHINNNNKQQEYYLTDIVGMAVKDGIDICTTNPINKIEVLGVNDKLQLTNLTKKYQLMLAENYLKKGLYIIDKYRFDCRGEIIFDNDCIIDINVIFIGNNKLGSNVSIGANCIIENSVIGDNSKVLPNSIITNTNIKNNVGIGPFAHIRPQTTIGNNSRIGNFVEIKKSIIKSETKISHLSYIGDSVIGTKVNIGAGVITCNYDGKNKYQTFIANNAFIGSNAALIAPVKIGKNTIIGAGSVISKNVADNTLAVTRAKQKNIVKK